MSRAKMAELIVILFGVWTCRSPVNCVFDGNQDPPVGRGTFGDILGHAQGVGS